eukprot:15431015-Alexandrium_andersonii.AAC.1
MSVGVLAVTYRDRGAPMFGPREGYSDGCRIVRFRNMRNCMTCSKLELRGPRSVLEIDTWRSGK